MAQLTDQERKAMLWLDMAIAGDSLDYSDRATHARAIKAMLAQPRMPEEPTKAMLEAMYQGYWSISNESHPANWKPCYAALYAELSKAPEPATKEVDVWRIEAAALSGDRWIPCSATYRTESEALMRANVLRAEGYRCVIVNAVKQRVPA